MQTIYLDYNALRYFVKKFPRDGSLSETDERAALTRALSLYPQVRFVVSNWVLAEPTLFANKVPNHIALITRYAEFLLSLKPLHLLNKFAVQREEMKRCVFAHLGLANGSTPLQVFHEKITDAWQNSSYRVIPHIAQR